MSSALLALFVLSGLAGASLDPEKGSPLASSMQEVEGRARLGHGCLPRTHYLTFTSTKVIPSTVYATSVHLVPTTLVQDLTHWHLHTSTVVEAMQTVTSYQPPRVITTTKFLTATKYATKVRHMTETKYVTRTESRAITDSVVATHHVTTTRPVAFYVTSTVTTTTTRHQLGTRVFTTTLYQFVTITSPSPTYVTRTSTSYYGVYDTSTVTRTEDEYVTHTSLVIQTRVVTRCSMAYGPTAAPFHVFKKLTGI